MEDGSWVTFASSQVNLRMEGFLKFQVQETNRFSTFFENKHVLHTHICFPEYFI